MCLQRTTMKLLTYDFLTLYESSNNITNICTAFYSTGFNEKETVLEFTRYNFVQHINLYTYMIKLFINIY